MADTDVTTYATSLAKPYISFIQGQIEASPFLPSGVGSSIVAQFVTPSSASASSGQSAPSAQSPASGSSASGASNSGASDTQASAGAATGAAVGTALAQPTISYIQSQIEGLLPSEIASAITANFPNASSSSGEGGSAVQLPIPAAVQNLFVPSAELRNFLSTLGDQSN